jgi:subtilisin family serine protease
VESDLVAVLNQIAELPRRYRAGEPDGHALDVLNLSMGYYHETPEDALTFDPVMLQVLAKLNDNGTVVVASAGNDATSRPRFPAAFAQVVAGRQPHLVVSVGALNPNGTDALFSNTGSWVSTYRPGAAVVSTMPPFQGGYEPMARTSKTGRTREAIDPDDFTGGFGVWSGTSFSAPIAAALVAQALLGQLELNGQIEDAVTAVAKGRGAIETSLKAAP